MGDPRRRSAAAQAAVLRSCAEIMAPDDDTILDLAFGPLWFRLLTRPGHLDEGFAHDVADLVVRALGLREVARGR